MRLGELAFTSYIFSKMDDGTYEEFLRNTGGHFNIEKSGHSQHLLNWLRKWGMRNAKNADEAATERLIQWHKQYGHELPDENRNIWDLDGDDLQTVRSAYKSLLEHNISYTTPNNRNRSISFGAIGAAKILFALRPKAFPPWDNKIRKKLHHDGWIIGDSDVELYLSLIKYINKIILELRQKCSLANFQLTELPTRLHRPNSTTIPKLIDEYHWITITRGIEPPDRETLQEWLNWL